MDDVEKFLKEQIVDVKIREKLIDLGFVGKFLGSGDNAKINICFIIVILLLIIALVTNTWDKIDVGAILMIIVGYIAGKKDN